MFRGEIIRSFSELTGTAGAGVFLLFLKPFVALKIFCKVFREAFLEVSEMVLEESAEWYFITETGET